MGPSFAAHHDWARAGDVMVSLRALSALVVVDPDDATVEWMSRGPWLRQHDPDPLANGHLLVFDNLGHGGEAGSSRIVEWAPDDGRIVWSYTGSADRPFLCPWGGGQQLLPNGHVLVGDTASGRMFEVDRRGERVWQFENPVRTRSPDGREFVATLTRRIQYVEPGSLSYLDAP
ncbi:MAG: arylsulfotransferase family protein [Bradymonadaceae bacterium]